MRLRAKLLSQDGLIVYTDWLELNTEVVPSPYDTLVWISGTIRVPRDLPTDPDPITLPEHLKHLAPLAGDRRRVYLLRDVRGMEAFITIADERPIASFSGNVHRLPG